MAIDNGDGTLDYTDEYTTGDWFSVFDNAIGDVITQTTQTTQTAGSSGDWNYLTAPRNAGPTVDFGAGSTQSGGVALGVGDSKSGGSWFDSAMKWFDDDKSGLKGATTVSLAGSFLKGIFSASTEKANAKNAKRITDAKVLDSQTAANVAAQKFANAGSIAQTNFGATPTGLIYSNHRKIDPMIRKGVA